MVGWIVGFRIRERSLVLTGFDREMINDVCHRATLMMLKKDVLYHLKALKKRDVLKICVKLLSKNYSI